MVCIPSFLKEAPACAVATASFVGSAPCPAIIGLPRSSFSLSRIAQSGSWADHNKRPRERERERERFYSVKWRKMAVGRFAQGRKGSCSHFFSILQYKMEKKWPSAVQNKMSQKWAPNEGSFWVPGKMSSNWRGRWLKATSPCQKWLVWALKSPKPRI